MRWFVERVYPAVRSAVPDVRLYVVGARPVRSVRHWNGRDGIVVTGFVADIRDYLGAADVCIVPLQIARGVQNKLLEAMAMGKAVVSTTAALDGISAVPGTDVVAADDAQAFASATIDLLSAPAAADRLGRNARLYVERNHVWQNNLRLLDDIFA
jgi:glycosyltransferase involved in cell wall biosynthesis